MPKKKINHGYKYEAPKFQDYNLGGLSKVSRKILQPDKNWIPFLPLDEAQFKHGVETNSCVSFGLCNQKETLERRLFGEGFNSSDRYLAIASETSETGNTPDKVYETARKIAGFIPEELLPFDESIKSQEDFLQPNPLNKKYFDEGRKWLYKFDLKHEWVGPTEESLKQGLLYYPIGISVEAWFEDVDGFYVRGGGRDNHWTILAADGGEFAWIYDTYPGSDGKYLKKVRWDFFNKKTLAKGISITLNQHEKRVCCLRKLLKLRNQ